MREFSLITRARSGEWLTQKSAVAICLLIILAMTIWVIHIFPPTFDTDFISFYAASLEVARGIPLAAYDSTAHHLTQTNATGCCTARWYAFFYPPVMLLFVWPLAFFSFKAAFFVWGGAQLALFMISLRQLVGRGLSLIPYLAFPAVFISLSMGQNALLTGAIFAGGTAAFKLGRPLLGGLIFGCLIYKPHFGILLPIAFISGREWKGLIGAALSTCALIIASALAFGVDAWFIYLYQTSSEAVQSFTNQDVAYYYLVSPYAGARLLGIENSIARLIQLGFTIAAMLLVAIVWRRSKNIAVRSAILIAGTLLAAPVILFYDLLLIAVVIAWIVVDAKTRGWLPWEKTLLITLYPLVFIAPFGSQVTGLPYGLLCTLITMSLAWRRFTFTPKNLLVDK